ncbi:MAG: hypothetical protein HRT36_05895 [Alphaproteobacteria bacterium]|nr:hypothetical protein [Alphaproteobacteria bacterium]
MDRGRFSLEEDQTLDVVNDVRELASARLMLIVLIERPIHCFCSPKTYGVNGHVAFIAA